MPISSWASVFMPYLRYLAKIHNYNVEQQFPVVGIIYGDSNGGKSTFVKLLSKMMSNAKIKQNSSGDFTGTNTFVCSASNQFPLSE